jgi:hypothetical protein
MHRRTWLAMAAGVSLLAGCGFQPPTGTMSSTLLPPGSVAPPLAGEGWLNGEGHAPEELAGKVIVLDAWAHW